MDLTYTGRNGESNFEKSLIKKLKNERWEEVLNNPSEEDLIKNWKNIIYFTNRKELHDVPLSDSEMSQIMEYVKTNCNTPVKANTFINGQDICIIRDSNSKDKENAGKPIYLNIFNRREIAGGTSRYQIAKQPNFKTSKEFNNRRGDVMLLIDGIPVIHIELKASGVPIEEATNQIQKYAKEGVFSGIFSLIQVFFAMTPEDCVYFANPGDYRKFNSSFFFHWADKKNTPIKDWQQLCSGENSLLSIPAAHELIGYYTIASKDIDSLMVVRSYQRYAINKILQRVNQQKWGNREQLGGYIWCTTGGGKTLTSFKVGQLIIDKKLADKVVYVVDRIELNNQSLEEYNSFQRDGEKVQETTSTNDLYAKLKSSNFKDSLIVTSMQKLNKIDETIASRRADLDYIRTKKVVFIIDEAHRSQFGLMHERVINTFDTALFIGFTGTPIFSDNHNDGATTETVFGPCLSIYSIADGIRDNNVLGFDPRAIKTYNDKDLKEEIALQKCGSKTKPDPQKDPKRYKIYLKYTKHTKMKTTYDKDGNRIDGIEDLLPTGQYDCDEHRNTVVDDILGNWDILSIGEKGTKFHAILATTSISEACAYYRLFKAKKTTLRVIALFDPTIDNNSQYALEKQDSLIEIINDYNIMYNQHFDRDNDPGFKRFKKDIIARLSHKKQYKHMNPKGDKETLDLVIVVDQLLTGFDSKYINTLYLDKVLEKDNIIQAISRTNRIYDKEEKPFGIFRFYRKPYTMQDNLKDALRLYCEGDTNGVIVKNLEENIEEIKNIYVTIVKIFKDNEIENFDSLPKSDIDCQKFKKEFATLKLLMNSIKLQGFKWDVNCNTCRKSKDCSQNIEDCIYTLPYTQETYNVLEKRYSDLSHRRTTGGGRVGTFGFDLPSIKSEMDMAKIDDEYLESHFKKVVPIIASLDIPEMEKDKAIEEFEKELPHLSMIHQEYAKRIISDIRNGILLVEEDMTLMQYIQMYIEKDVDDIITNEANLFGLNKDLLKEIYLTSNNERELNEHNRFVTLLNNADNAKIVAYFYNKENKQYTPFIARSKLDKELKEFIFGKNKDN